MRTILSVVLAAGLLVGCGDDRTQQGGQVTVFAAASLTEAFGALGKAYMAANPETTLTFNFAGSSELAAQIIEGAPADVFASANPANITKLVEADQAAGQSVQFATNRSAIVVAPGNPLGIDGVADLADPELVVVTCAEQVPCGAYATEIFAKAGVEVTPDSYEENVKAVVSKVVLGEADAGISYSTDITAAGDQVAGVEIPDDINVVADYPIVVTAEAANPDGGQAFIEFVLSEAGQSILGEFGFSAP